MVDRRRQQGKRHGKRGQWHRQQDGAQRSSILTQRIDRGRIEILPVPHMVEDRGRNRGQAVRNGIGSPPVNSIAAISTISIASTPIATGGAMPTTAPAGSARAAARAARGWEGALPGMPTPASYRSTAKVAATPAAADSIEISA